MHTNRTYYVRSVCGSTTSLLRKRERRDGRKEREEKPASYVFLYSRRFQQFRVVCKKKKLSTVDALLPFIPGLPFAPLSHFEFFFLVSRWVVRVRECTGRAALLSVDRATITQFTGLLFIYNISPPPPSPPEETRV